MLELSITFPISVQNGGLFISRGKGRHPGRKLDSWEIIFVEKGTLTLREEERVFAVNAGETLLLWPHRYHEGTEDFPADLRFYWLHFDITDSPVSRQEAKRLALIQHSRTDDPQYLTSLFRQFLTEQEKIERSAALELIVLLILQHMTHAASQQEQNNEAGVALAWKAQQLIRTRFHLPLTTSQLAQELHCNADYLGRVYRRVFHLTLTDAIQRQRVRAAEKMLVSHSVSLKEVALACGFNNVSYFRQIFRRHTGLTPAVWKQRYCKEHINTE